MCRDRIYFEKSNGEEHQLSSIINIVTGTRAASECENDARCECHCCLLLAAVEAARAEALKVFDALLGTFRDQSVNMTAREGR